MIRRPAVALLAVLAASTGAAQPVSQLSSAEIEMSRQVWRQQKVPDVKIVQRVYNRVISLTLPRPFVPAYRVASPGFYIVEYVPDGQTVQNWTQMITVTGSLGAGAARIDDTELAAALFDRGDCAGRVYTDRGSTPPMPAVTGRTVVIGCGAADQRGSERGAIAVFRDAENSWTVQYAERNAGKPISVEGVAAQLARLTPLVLCRADDTAAECGTARTPEAAK